MPDGTAKIGAPPFNVRLHAVVGRRASAWEDCYTRGVLFEWDPEKAAANLENHGVGFEEAATVFDDPLADTFDDPDHSADEERFLTFGSSPGGRALLVSHCDRDDRVRIIHARLMGRREKEEYEEGKR